MVMQIITIISTITIIASGFITIIYCYIKDDKKYKLRNK